VAAFGLSTLAGGRDRVGARRRGLLHQQPIPFSVADLMGSVAAIVQPIAEEKGLAVRLVPPPADARVGQPAVLSRVRAQPHDQTPSNSRSRAASRWPRRSGRGLGWFSVQDSGRGIPAQGWTRSSRLFAAGRSPRTLLRAHRLGSRSARSWSRSLAQSSPVNVGSMGAGLLRANCHSLRAAEV